jgi:hypothetical protein
MSLGPVELIVIEFPGNEFRGEIAPALKALVDSHTIRIIDLVFISRDESGVVHSRELTEVESDLMLTWDPLVDDVLGLLSGDDIQQLGQSLGLNSSAALMLFENVWATDFRDAVVRANGRLVFSERIPRAIVDQAMAGAAPEAATA